MKFAMKPAGWRYESYRHSLAAKGIRTGKQGYFSRKYLRDQYNTGPEFGSSRDDEKIRAEYERRRTAENLKQARGFANYARMNPLYGDEEENIAERLAELELGAATYRGASPAYKESQALRNISAAARQELAEERKFSRIIESIDAGEFDRVTIKREDGTFADVQFDEALRSLPRAEYNSAVSQIRRKVTELAKAGIVTKIDDVPASIREYVATDPTTTSLIKSYAEDRRDAQKSSFLGRAGNTAGTLAVSAVAGTEVLARSFARGAQYTGGTALEGLQEAGPGFFGNPDIQIEGPEVKNVFFDGYRPGRFSPTSSLPGKEDVQRLLGIDEGGLFGRAAAERPPTQNELVQKEIDEMYSARKRFTDIDLNSYDEGIKAFEEGDRESLLKAITDLESQEQTLSDRWMLVEQTRAQVMKPENRAYAYGEPDKGFLKGLFGQESGGGKVLADRTKKVNEVKKMLKDASNELFARRKLLRYKLQRMDSVVPPASDAPKNVRVLNERAPVADWLTVPPQTSPRGVLQDVFANKPVPVEDLSQNAPPGV